MVDSKIRSTGSLSGGAPHKLAGRCVWGGGGSPPRQEDSIVIWLSSIEPNWIQSFRNNYNSTFLQQIFNCTSLTQCWLGDVCFKLYCHPVLSDNSGRYMHSWDTDHLAFNSVTLRGCQCCEMLAHMSRQPTTCMLQITALFSYTIQTCP